MEWNFLRMLEYVNKCRIELNLFIILGIINFYI